MREKTYIVKITPQAESHLIEITNYFVNELKELITAKRILDKIERSILSLSTLPYRTKLIDSEPWRSYGIRVLSVNNFLVYLWIDEENGIVHVIAVVYSRRDQLKHLLHLDFK